MCAISVGYVIRKLAMLINVLNAKRMFMCFVVNPSREKMKDMGRKLFAHFV
jgi:hypothetical protein